MCHKTSKQATDIMCKEFKTASDSRRIVDYLSSTAFHCIVHDSIFQFAIFVKHWYLYIYGMFDFLCFKYKRKFLNKYKENSFLSKRFKISNIWIIKFYTTRKDSRFFRKYNFVIKNIERVKIKFNLREVNPFFLLPRIILK